MLIDKVLISTRWLLVVGIAYTSIASLSYFLLPIGTIPGALPGRTAPVASAAPTLATLDLIESKHPFGIPQVEAPLQPQPREVATSLPLELRGVFVSGAPGESVAILARRNHSGALYRVGETVPGEVELVAVRSDHVLLNNGGQTEILRFTQRPPANRQYSAVLGSDAPMPVANHAYEPVRFIEDHPDRYKPGFSGVLGRVVETTDEGG